ncbi:MAG TPA: hypothetical protein PK878_19850 [bacterium]|nr:hypothetical protein [Candidatus Omnitrophota bacterium]HOJ62539.1 hypothetical protein [bacterium]HOL95358.1 hypothetical protein [bacterium]HPP02307.1 hypothetical protein [bacterium]
MSTTAASFESQIAQDLANLIQRLSREIGQQKELTDSKAFTLIRLYLSAIRQYMSLQKQIAAAEAPQPAAPSKPSGSPHANGLKQAEATPQSGQGIRPRLAIQTYPPLEHPNPVSPEPFPAPGLLRNPPKPAPAVAVRTDLTPRPLAGEGAATRLK